MDVIIRISGIMRLENRSDLCSFTGVFLDSLERFLVRNRCDAA